jgi:SWI/SNF-related matrix-associated actin-dependent regulator 1 of chromatin subfamily A
MGLGKTIQSLAYRARQPTRRPAIIITPASLKLNWQREAARWLTTPERIAVLSGTTPDPAALAEATLVIVNYDVLAAWRATLQAIAAPVVILDEAHYAKNRKAARSQAAAALTLDAPHLILLTGTPILNRPAELWPLLNLVAPADWPDFPVFAFRYCDPQQVGIGRKKSAWDFSGASNLDELNERIKPYVIRRTKAQVLAELPPKRRAVIPLT